MGYFLTHLLSLGKIQKVPLHIADADGNIIESAQKLR